MPLQSCQRRRQAGVSLLSTLLTLVTLGIMAALVVDMLPGGDDDDKGATKKETIEELTEQITSSTAPTASTAAPRRGPGGPGGLSRPAAAAACQADVASLEGAVATAHAATGKYPASISELVASRFLSAAPNRPGYTFTLEVASGTPTGRVLVNGQPGAAGC